MSTFYAFLTLLFVFFFEFSFLGSFRVFGVVPNLLFLSILLFAIFDTRNRVYGFAVFFGLLLDIFTGIFFGFHMLLFVLSVGFARAVSKTNGGATPIPVVLGIFTLTLLVYYIVQIMYFYTSDGTTSLSLFLKFGVQYVVDIAVGIVIFLFSYRYFDFIKKVEKKYDERVKR